MDRRNAPAAERFFDKVEKMPSGCWEWQGGIDSYGYGQFIIPGTSKAHRASWILFNGPIPDGLCACHHCDNRRCVRPTHLFLGTPVENVADRVAKGRSGGRRKLTEAQVLAIRGSNTPTGELAARYGVHRNSIGNARNVYWKHI